MSADAGKPVFFATPKALRAWFMAHSATATELLAGFHKVDSGVPSVTWSESVDEALCVGWIDGVRRRIDDARYSVRFTPRKPTSIWSAVNIAKVERLREEGRMTAAGERAFACRLEGRSRVYAYEQADAAALSGAEQAAFKGDQAAWAYFEACPTGYRRTLLHWVTEAKRAETRRARLEKLMAACAAGKRLR